MRVGTGWACFPPNTCFFFFNCYLLQWKKSEYPILQVLPSPELRIYVNTGTVFPWGKNLLVLSILWSSSDEACCLQLIPVLTVLLLVHVLSHMLLSCRRFNLCLLVWTKAGLVWLRGCDEWRNVKGADVRGLGDQLVAGRGTRRLVSMMKSLPKTWNTGRENPVCGEMMAEMRFQFWTNYLETIWEEIFR